MLIFEHYKFLFISIINKKSASLKFDDQLARQWKRTKSITMQRHILAHIAHSFLREETLEEIRMMGIHWTETDLKTYTGRLNVQFKSDEPVHNFTRFQTRLARKIFEIN